MRFQSCKVVFTKKGELAKSILAFGSSKLMLGTICLCFSCRTVFIRPAIPATVSKCPMFDLTEAIAQYWLRSLVVRKA